MNKHIMMKTASVQHAAVIETLPGEVYTEHYLTLLGHTQIDYMLRKFQSQNAIQNDLYQGCFNLGAFLSKFGLDDYILEKRLNERRTAI